MTRDEALTEAQRRWGAQARVESERLSDGRMLRVVDPNIVGRDHYEGWTWDAAFADADRRTGQ